MTDTRLTILITGASSYAGSRIYFDLKDKYSLIGTYFSNPLSDKFHNLDLSDREEVLKFFAEKRPDIVVHKLQASNLSTVYPSFFKPLSKVTK